MANYIVTDTELTNIANAIRSKTGSTATLAYPSGFNSAIVGIEIGYTIGGFINVTYPAGSTCTAVSEDGITLTAPDTSGSCTFAVYDPPTLDGTEWTVSCTNGNESDSLSITINYGDVENIALAYIMPLVDCTPAKILQVAQAGVGDTWWDIGDRTAPITLSSYGNFTGVSTVCAFIIGFNHNSELEGTGIHFLFGELTDGTMVALVDSGYGSSHSSGNWFGMNTSDSNSGGWDNMTMYTTILPGFYNTSMPTEWKNIIIDTVKYSDNTKGTASSNITATTEKMWLLSEYEVYGTNTKGNTYESTKCMLYDYYKNGNSKIRYKHNATTTTCYWKLRTPITSSSWSFVSVGTDGNVYDDNWGYKSAGFAPGFRVG